MRPRTPLPEARRPVALDEAADPLTALSAAFRAGADISLLTSGTTDRPRRVVRSAASWVDSFGPAAALAELDTASAAWIPGPLTASMNLFAAALVAHLGARRVGRPAEASHAFLTPAALAGLLDGEVLVAPGLRLVVAGDRLSPGLAERAEARGWRVGHYYGAAQLSFVAWGRDSESLRPFPEVQVRAVDGVLWVRSPWVCSAELPPPGVAPSLRRLDGADGPWWGVGDHGTVTADGEVRVAGRDGAVVTGGATVVLAEVEAVLAESARGEVHLVGLPHPRLGAVLAAVCTDPEDAERLPGLARTVLPAAQRPRRWLLRPRPPRTSAGKVDRTALADWAATQ